MGDNEEAAPVQDQSNGQKEAIPYRRSRRSCVQTSGPSIYIEAPDEDELSEEESEEESEDEEGNKTDVNNANDTNDKDEDRDEDGQDEAEDCQDDDEEEDQENGEDGGESDDEVCSRRLRRRKATKVKETEQTRQKMRRISAILKVPDSSRTKEDKQFLRSNGKLSKEVRRRLKMREKTANRKLEIEDSPELQLKKTLKLAKAIEKAKNLVVYTGAGISTAADIPDYRGPNGIWTLLDQGKTLDQFDGFCKDLAQAKPTFTHMALFSLYKRGKLKHIVSQNCDGLHLRSGIPRYALSELHGNMFVEICKRCKPMRPFVRLFDVTEKTSKNRHTTRRRCHVCGSSLFDSIVHFGERGSLKWPLNWDGASKAAEKADVILCLGSSLKVLRRYPWLWCMDRPKSQRPDLFIINLQWTPKDSAANLKINGRCDAIMRKVMETLELHVPDYFVENDPLLSYSTRLHDMETHTCTKKPINFIKQEIKTEEEEEEPTGNGVQLGVESWRLDHDYCDAIKVKIEPKQEEYSLRPKSLKNGFSKAAKKLDFQMIRWPRDALYIPYEVGEKFEYMNEMEQAYFCDCCDPSKKRKRKESTSSSSGSETSSDEDETTGESAKTSARNSDEESVCSKSDSTSLNSVKNGSSSNGSAPPGWFGKGRRTKKHRTT